ncbi:hypothetical protein OEIGOIKO_07156 [Streptomyces chrestomyceticus JCM 4735]|uniref:Chaplin domain-containing protein n=1 Tax=Streptomyces chrestomyceticus JCM 4735 TaxID=1306181 RepID=A0A7U9L1H1_9ACTN|nr:hypothetical protein [Streptomyces chrestomyceticus]GCD39326.1 hypothetical protein OEIGOIKO_07156 [Streptomyces chrestomyceticus JCM 4735]
MTYDADRRSQAMASHRTVTSRTVASLATTTLAVTAAAAAVSLVGAAPASAGGLIVIGSPSHDNTCRNGVGTVARGAATHGTGNAAGLLGQIPFGSPLNHCGGADLPGNKQGNEAPDDDPGLEYAANQPPSDTRYPGAGQTDFLKLFR